MKQLLKQLLKWKQRTEPEKHLLRYRLLYAASFLACLFPLPLTFLLRACRSDKHGPLQHQYGHTFDSLFRRFKYKAVKLLEIGIGGYKNGMGGQSLNAWQCYFPFGTLVACDILPREQLQTPRTKIYRLDQSSEAQLLELRSKEGPFDIIMDDGSHRSPHQILTFKVLFQSVNRGGIYVIEDVQTSYWQDWDGASVTSPAFADTCVGYFLEMTKYLNHEEFADGNAEFREQAIPVKQIIFEHNLIIVLKG